MDMLTYYTTTLSASFAKIGPVIVFIGVGYVVFIKLPFLLLFKATVQKHSSNFPELKQDFTSSATDYSFKQPKYESLFEKEKEPEPQRPKSKPENSTDSKEKSQSKDWHQSSSQANSKSQQSKNNSQEKEKQSKTQDQHRQQKSQEKKDPPKQDRPTQTQSPEAVFELHPGQSFSKKELKQKYYDLLKMNHPDKVASLGADFKTLAERKTKDINSAYEKLKNRAS